MGGPAFVGRVARRASSAKSPWSTSIGRGALWPFTGDRAILAGAASPRWLAGRSGRRVRPTSGDEDARSPDVRHDPRTSWFRRSRRGVGRFRGNARPSCESHRGARGRARTELRHFYSTPLNKRGSVREKGQTRPPASPSTAPVIGPPPPPPPRTMAICRRGWRKMANLAPAAGFTHGCAGKRRTCVVNSRSLSRQRGIWRIARVCGRCGALPCPEVGRTLRPDLLAK
jgi:hypothetical protein